MVFNKFVLPTTVATHSSTQPFYLELSRSDAGTLGHSRRRSIRWFQWRNFPVECRRDVTKPLAHRQSRACRWDSSGEHLFESKRTSEGAVSAISLFRFIRNSCVYDYREAHAIGLQSQELEEAERLEREALTHREQAVAHGTFYSETVSMKNSHRCLLRLGAHPDNRHLGASSS